MKSKLKECDGCQKMTIIWKNHEGLRLCKYCWSCQNPKNRDSSQKPNDYKVPQVSSKKKKKDTESKTVQKQTVQKVANNLEISSREVSLYIEQFNLQLPNEKK